MKTCIGAQENCFLAGGSGEARIQQQSSAGKIAGSACLAAESEAARNLDHSRKNSEELEAQAGGGEEARASTRLPSVGSATARRRSSAASGATRFQQPQTPSRSKLARRSLAHNEKAASCRQFLRGSPKSLSQARPLVQRTGRRFRIPLPYDDLSDGHPDTKPTTLVVGQSLRRPLRRRRGELCRSHSWRDRSPGTGRRSRCLPARQDDRAELWP